MQLAEAMLRGVVVLLLCARAAPLAPSALRRERAPRECSIREALSRARLPFARDRRASPRSRAGVASCRPFARASVACFTATDETVSDPPSAPDAPTASADEAAAAAEASASSSLPSPLEEADESAAPAVPTPADDEAATPPLSAMSGGAEAEGEKGAATSAGDDAASEPESAESAASPEWWSEDAGEQDAPVDDTMASIFQNMPEELQTTAPEPEAAAAPAPEPEEERKFTFEDFVGSEWKVGLLWRGKDEADVTWARCEADESVTWGFGARGKWRIDEVRRRRARARVRRRSRRARPRE